MVEAMGMKNPYFDMHEGTAKNTSIIEGREVINYSSYNYIGLSGDERIIEEVHQAAKKYGTSVSASARRLGRAPLPPRARARAGEGDRRRGLDRLRLGPRDEREHDRLPDEAERPGAAR